MAFVDEIKVNIKAGKGGDGVVRWRHEKGKEFMGPSGGDGGNGADVFVRGKKSLSLLQNYAHKKNFVAENGKDGSKDSLFGHNGNDLIIDIPIGSVVTNLDTGKVVDVLEVDVPIQILKAGRGGHGNEHFKSSTNVTPKESTPGKIGEQADFSIELQLIADAGFIGLPNVGKSTLLNSLTNAKSKVANFSFTTLEPHLGGFQEFILADIPGLIKGASLGKGLGHKFLRHINRMKVLIHCIAADDPDVKDSYEIIRTELGDFNKKLLTKKEVIVLTKIDEISEEELQDKVEQLEKDNKQVLTVTILDDDSIKKLLDDLIKILRGK